MALYVKFECATCENENYYGHSLQTTVKVCDGYKHTDTNVDLIRAMTDEELTEYIRVFFPEVCPPVKCPGGDYCYKCWLDWLKSPAEVDNG